ncbi:hypothetical protein GIB67_017682 [Kingdonia uniflora]|uniref:Uncharacterized protein n=1 Tax=Kingdonia uniflora TaxID=39325 RepID=A0A7J7NB63_9MAGN|nr:hypothetical protein GIB67_017682 [Kingdonia uniflora]
MVVATITIWRNEGFRKAPKLGRPEETLEEMKWCLYEDEAWKPCLKDIHPVWLLGFRVIGFFLLLTLLIVNVAVDGGGILFYYTQWTFGLVTIYFGLGSLLSMHGCYKYRNKVGGDTLETDAEQGTYMASVNNTNVHNIAKNTGPDELVHVRQTAGIWGYVFQVIFQMNAGAVMLTDFVFWLIIVPFLAIKDYDLNILLIGMHSINAVFLLGDAALNSLRFPWFRIAYFLLWTAIFVIFQWAVHACVSIWWPYPFLDLASPYAPVWYMVVGLMHIPCYAFFALLIRMKHILWTRWFPQSYQCSI